MDQNIDKIIRLWALQETRSDRPPGKQQACSVAEFQLYMSMPCLATISSANVEIFIQRCAQYIYYLIPLENQQQMRLSNPHWHLSSPSSDAIGQIPLTSFFLAEPGPAKKDQPKSKRQTKT